MSKFPVVLSERKSVQNSRGGNSIEKDYSSLFQDTVISITGKNNVVKFGRNCRITGLRILIQGDGNEVWIGNDVIINASKNKPTVVNALGGKKIVIGNGAMLSNNIEIHTSDYHGIYDKKSGQRINGDKDVIIHDRVWIGLRCIILKGTEIASGCVVGAGSLLSGKYETSDCILSGHPAHGMKSEIIWDLNMTDSLVDIR